MTPTDKPPAATKKPVFNIDADPANANWIRTLARQRAEANGETVDGEPLDQSTPEAAAPAETPTGPPPADAPPPPVIEDVEDVPINPPATPAPAEPKPGFARKGWSTTAKKEN